MRIEREPKRRRRRSGPRRLATILIVLLGALIGTIITLLIFGALGL